MTLRATLLNNMMLQDLLVPADALHEFAVAISLSASEQTQLLGQC